MSFYMHAHTPSNATYEYAEHVHAHTHTHASVHANTLAASAGRLEQKQPPHTYRVPTCTNTASKKHADTH